MILGEILAKGDDIELNAGCAAITLTVANRGDRAVQVGLHYHFAEPNSGLDFDRTKAHGMRLDFPAGSAVRFEPGRTRGVTLVPFRGACRIVGFNGQVMGAID